MGFMDWSEEYRLDVSSMDDQHRGLIDLMNQIHERYTAGAPADELLR